MESLVLLVDRLGFVLESWMESMRLVARVEICIRYILKNWIKKMLELIGE